jgi:hypothetical protein
VLEAGHDAGDRRVRERRQIRQRAHLQAAPLSFCQQLEDEEVARVCFVLTQCVSLDLTRDDRVHAIERAQRRDLFRVKFEGRETSA